MKINKYTLEIGTNKLEIINFYSFLDAQVQDGKLVLWVEVDNKYALEGTTTFDVVVYGTGHEINEDELPIYISTFQLGEFVGHVYYKQIEFKP